jgi:hypothetical protein
MDRARSIEITRLLWQCIVYNWDEITKDTGNITTVKARALRYAQAYNKISYREAFYLRRWHNCAFCYLYKRQFCVYCPGMPLWRRGNDSVHIEIACKGIGSPYRNIIYSLSKGYAIAKISAEEIANYDYA